MGKEEDFIGKKAMEERGEPKITRIGLKVTGRGIIREHQDIYVGEKKIGHTTSGTHCPFLGYPIAMALVDAGSVEIGNKVEESEISFVEGLKKRIYKKRRLLRWKSEKDYYMQNHMSG